MEQARRDGALRHLRRTALFSLVRLQTVSQLMRDSVQNYVKHGLHPGGFLRALIVSDIGYARCLADERNLANMDALTLYVQEHVPCALRGDAAFDAHCSK
jgi:hypothetical protein